ncbi:MAG: glucosamine-6-phosphate deaminase [Chloroflexi bacterium]|nr:glucosamine-6-phosphate deaminase [Chloroflexota bacterium]
MRVHTVATGEEFDREAAGVVCAVVRERPAAAIGLPSGRTPLGMYAQLARRIDEESADFSRVAAFGIDELHGVRAAHPATNSSYFREHLTTQLPLRALHVLDCESEEPEAECERFTRLIEEAGGLDLAVLGIGVNGHIAFNEPGSSFSSHARKVALDETTRRLYAQHFGSAEAAPAFGLTLGIADLLAARRVLLLASGIDKTEVIARALEGPIREALPASALQRHPELTVILDREAASGLREHASG